MKGGGAANKQNLFTRIKNCFTYPGVSPTASARIKIYVQPRASKTAIVGMHGDCVHIRLAAPPVDNAANEALVALVAARLGITKGQVRVVAGSTSRRKVIEIDGATAETARSALLTASAARKGR